MIELPSQRTPDVMRIVNELVREGFNGEGRAQPVAFFCECSDSGCYRPVWLTIAEYELVRDDPDRVALASEHEVAAGPER
jgi:hypothetical protein